MDKICQLLKNEAQGLFDSITPVSSNMAQCNTYGISWHTGIKFENFEGKWVYPEGEIPEKVLELERDKLIYLYHKLIDDIKNKKIIFSIKQMFLLILIWFWSLNK